MPHHTNDPAVALDEIDAELLRRLGENARTANSDLARAVGLSPSACLARIRRLRKSGVITGFTTTISPRALGYTFQALVNVRIRPGARHMMGQLTEELRALPEVSQLFVLGGTEDFLIHVQVRDADHVRQFVLDNLSSNPSVALTETNMVFEHHQGRGGLPS